jgi:K+-sensing histidine kinase KdpD
MAAVPRKWRISASIRRKPTRRRSFYAKNLEPGSDLPAAARQKLSEAIAGLLHFLHNEIRAILTYQYGNNFAMDLAFRLETIWARLKKALGRLRRQLATAGKLDKNSFMESLPLPPGRITPADLVYVLDELVQNALRHVDGNTAQIGITVRQALDELHVDVRDNGRGIPENLWEEIFRPGFTTKPDGKGGFGLYHARQRLEKYGGKIFVAASELGKGTTMRICLKAEIHLENEVENS